MNEDILEEIKEIVDYFTVEDEPDLALLQPVNIVYILTRNSMAFSLDNSIKYTRDFTGKDIHTIRRNQAFYIEKVYEVSDNDYTPQAIDLPKDKAIKLKEEVDKSIANNETLFEILDKAVKKYPTVYGYMFSGTDIDHYYRNQFDFIAYYTGKLPAKGIGKQVND